MPAARLPELCERARGRSGRDPGDRGGVERSGGSTRWPTALEAQPAWSDISVLLFAGSDRDAAALRTLRKLEILRNVTLLERPVRVAGRHQHRAGGAARAAAPVRAARRARALHKARGEAEECEPPEGRVPRDAVARAAHAAERHPRVGLDAAAGALRSRARGAARSRSSSGTRKVQAQIIADVLDMSRMITGKHPAEPERRSAGAGRAGRIDTIGRRRRPRA